MSDFIPNSFQNPNAYVDRFMHLLTGEEFKVLTYMARRIFGWGKDSDRISMSQFQHGQTGRDGTRYDHGTGLAYVAIEKALAGLQQFRLARQVAPPDFAKAIAAEWTLETDSAKVDEVGLIARLAERSRQGKERTQGARSIGAERRKNGTPLSPTKGVESPLYPLSGTNPTPLVPLTPTPLVGLRDKTHGLNQELNPGCAPRDAPAREAAKSPVESPPTLDANGAAATNDVGFISPELTHQTRADNSPMVPPKPAASLGTFGARLMPMMPPRSKTIVDALLVAMCEVCGDRDPQTIAENLNRREAQAFPKLRPFLLAACDGDAEKAATEVRRRFGPGAWRFGTDPYFWQLETEWRAQGQHLAAAANPTQTRPLNAIQQRAENFRYAQELTRQLAVEAGLMPDGAVEMGWPAL